MKTSPSNFGLALLLAGACLPSAAWTADNGAQAMEKLAKDSKCFKCHGIDKGKDGPSFRDVAAKYKSDPEAVPKLIDHVTLGRNVKFEDGHEEPHKKIKTQDKGRIAAFVGWIRSLPGGSYQP